jgi:NAD(P)H-dependent FMN reductase
VTAPVCDAVRMLALRTHMLPSHESEAPPADVVGIDGSPTGAGRTAVAVGEIVRVAASRGAATDTISLTETEIDRVRERLSRADGVVIGSPIISASFAFPVKRLFDALSDTWGQAPTPLQGKAVVMVLTSVNAQHFLALDDLRGILGTFFAAHVVPSGLHIPAEGFTSDGALTEVFGRQAEQQGTALVEMISVLRRSPTLRGLGPQTFLRDDAGRR